MPRTPSPNATPLAPVPQRPDAPLSDDRGPVLRELPDLLEPGLALVFVGFNASIHAATTGHYYSRPANQFWRLMRENGLVPDDFHAFRDGEMPSFGLGITDLVKRPTNSADEVSLEEFREGARVLRVKLERFQPRGLCCNGKGVYALMTGRPPIGWGLQPEPFVGASVFVMPSTSGRANRFDRERREVLMAVRAFVAEARTPNGR